MARLYETAFTAWQREIIDNAYSAMNENLKAAGFKTTGDDMAEAIINSICQMLVKANKMPKVSNEARYLQYMEDCDAAGLTPLIYQVWLADENNEIEEEPLVKD